MTAAADVYSLGQVVGWFVTGKYPEQNRPLLPQGDGIRWRGFVRSCTELVVDHRLGDMEAVQQRLQEVFVESDVDPVERAHQLANRAAMGDAGDLEPLLALALDHMDNAALYLDHLARIPSQQVEAWVRLAPGDAASAAGRMARHLVEAQWGTRDRSYAGTPLHFVHAALRSLVAAGRLELAEDVAGLFFAAEVHWNNPKQKSRTEDWLSTLDEPAGVTIARALRSVPAAIAYHRQPAFFPFRSSTLQALLTSP